jgi:hypothetical protein
MSRDVSKISQIILGYYNSKYNKNEKREEISIKKSQQTLNKQQRNTTNYNKLITQPDDSNNKKDLLNKINMKKLMTIKENETKEQNRKKNDTKNIKTKDIKDIIKINNSELLKKIVYYRLLVIKKKISILKLILFTYIGTIVQLCIYDLDDSTKKELKENKKQITQFINNYIITKDAEMDKAINELKSFLDFYTNNL